MNLIKAIWAANMVLSIYFLYRAFRNLKETDALLDDVEALHRILKERIDQEEKEECN